MQVNEQQSLTINFVANELGTKFHDLDGNALPDAEFDWPHVKIYVEGFKGLYDTASLWCTASLRRQWRDGTGWLVLFSITDATRRELCTVMPIVKAIRTPAALKAAAAAFVPIDNDEAIVPIDDDEDDKTPSTFLNAMATRAADAAIPTVFAKEVSGEEVQDSGSTAMIMYTEPTTRVLCEKPLRELLVMIENDAPVNSMPNLSIVAGGMKITSASMTPEFCDRVVTQMVKRRELRIGQSMPNGAAVEIFKHRAFRRIMQLKDVIKYQEEQGRAPPPVGFKPKSKRSNFTLKPLDDSDSDSDSHVAKKSRPTTSGAGPSNALPTIARCVSRRSYRGGGHASSMAADAARLS